VGRTDSCLGGGSRSTRPKPIRSHPSGGPHESLPGCPQDSYYTEMLKSMYGLCAVDPTGKLTNVFSEPFVIFLGYAPTSFALVPWGDVGKTGCQRDVNNGVLPRVFPGAGWCPFGNPNQVETFTLGVGGTGCPLRISPPVQACVAAESLRAIAATFTTFTLTGHESTFIAEWREQAIALKTRTGWFSDSGRMKGYSEVIPR